MNSVARQINPLLPNRNMRGRNRIMHDEKLCCVVPVLQCNRYIANLLGKSRTPEGKKLQQTARNILIHAEPGKKW